MWLHYCNGVVFVFIQLWHKLSTRYNLYAKINKPVIIKLDFRHLAAKRTFSSFHSRIYNVCHFDDLMFSVSPSALSLFSLSAVEF